MASERALRADQQRRDRHRVDGLGLAGIGVGRQRHRHQVGMARRPGSPAPACPASSSLMPVVGRRLLQRARRCRQRRDHRVDLAGREQAQALGQPGLLDRGEIGRRHAAGGQQRLRIGARAGARLAELDALALQVGDGGDRRIPWQSRSGSAPGTGCPAPAARSWRRPPRTAPHPFAARAATSFWTSPTSASFCVHQPGILDAAASGDGARLQSAPAELARDDRGDVGILAARLAAGERRTPGRAGRRAAASSRRPWPAPRRRSSLRSARSPPPSASSAWTASSSRLASLGGPVLFSGEPSPTSGATHGTAAQLPPSSTKVALPWTRSRSPALLPPCLMPMTPFSVAPSSVANAVALRPFQDAKSTSWFSFSIGVVVDDAPRLAVGGGGQRAAADAAEARDLGDRRLQRRGQPLLEHRAGRGVVGTPCRSRPAPGRRAREDAEVSRRIGGHGTAPQKPSWGKAR